MSTKYKIVCLFVVIILLSYMSLHFKRKSPFKVWSERQEKLKRNVKSICKKYGASLRLRVPMTEFLYSSEDNLVFCRNAKVSFTAQ